MTMSEIVVKVPDGGDERLVIERAPESPKYSCAELRASNPAGGKKWCRYQKRGSSRMIRKQTES